MKDFINKINRLQNYINSDVQHDVGVEAVKHFKQSFHDEAFSDKSEKDMPWEEVKRRKNDGKNAASNRKILTGESGDLGESIQYHKEGRDTVISAPKVYAEIHNKGLEGNAFGKYKFTMPKRQFIGPSMLLLKKLNAKIAKRMTLIMKH